MKKVLTISIAAYNVESFIESTLESVCSSKHLDALDIIVQTNGANDKTPEIASKWAKKFPNSVRVINVDQNHGYGFTINNSIKHSRGEYFKQLDGDDWFDTKELDNLIDALFSAQCDAILNDYTFYYEDTHNKKRITHPYESLCDLPVSLINMYSMHSLTIKTDCLKTPTDIFVTEDCYYTDVEFFIKAISRARIFKYLPFNVYYYRWNREGQSMSYNSIVAHIKEHETVCKNCLEIVTCNGNLLGMHKAIETLAIKHLSYLLFCYPSKSNYESFLDYRMYLSKMRVEYRKEFRSVTKLAIIWPRLFYGPISRLKRKKYKIDYVGYVD